MSQLSEKQHHDDIEVVEAEIVETVEIAKREPMVRVIPHEPEPIKPLRVGETVHVRISHSVGSSCHAAIITDGHEGDYKAYVLPCGRCQGVPQRVSLRGIQYHRIDECDGR